MKLWDVASGALKTTFSGHKYGITEIAFSPDGQTLASGSWDGTILLWDLMPGIAAEIETPQLTEDANRDGAVDLQDLVFVASQFGQSGVENAADINGDGVVDIADILLVAGALETDNGAPAAYSPSIGRLTAAAVETWLIQAQQVNDKGAVFPKRYRRSSKPFGSANPERDDASAELPEPV